MKKYFGILTSLVISNALVFGQLWTVRYNGTGNGEDATKSMASDNTGNVYVSGSTYTGSGNYDYLTIKYNNSGVQQWQAKYNGPPGNGTDQANAVCVDNAGNVYVTGYSYQAAFFNNMDIATVKYNSQGVQQWVARFDGVQKRADAGTALKTDASGNVYVTGWTTDTHASYARKDIVTIKYNAAGVQQWAAQYNGPGNKDDTPSGIGVDGAGNVYVAGTSYAGTAGLNDCLTIKYNPQGVKQWENRYNGPENGYDYCGGITVDNAGNAYVTGSSYGTTDQDYVTVKYNASGTRLWQKTFDGPGHGYDISHAIALDNSGNVYVTGESQSASFKTDYRTIKYNSSGVQQWSATYNGTANDNDVANAIAIDAGGNAYVTGYINGAIDKWDVATVKYSASGATQWVKRYDGTGHKTDVGNAIGVDLNGNTYVAGTSAGSSSGSDWVMMKYGPATTGSRIAMESELTTLFDPGKLDLQNYPNPVKTSTKIKFHIPVDEAVKLDIYNIQGIEIATLVNGNLKAGSYEVQWNAGKSPAGNYYYKITAGEIKYTGKMVLLR